MSYAIWVTVLLGLLVIIPMRNPEQFAGLPIWVVVALAMCAIYTGLKGRDPGRGDAPPH